MADPVNKWDQPTAAPPPMFFGRKERDLVKQVNDELAERVVGQTVAYYPVSLKDSNYHPLYGEAVDKVTLPPIRVYAYVTVENEQTNERYGYEYQTKLTINFNRKRLTEDQNLFVRVGDFVQYGDEFYEIARTYNDTRYYFGQVEHKFQISAECIKARKGTFRIRGQMKKQTLVGTVTTASAALPLPSPPPSVPAAPNNAQYVVLSADDSLTKERVLTAGSGITLTDAGAGSTITIGSTGGSPSGSTVVYSSTGLETSGYLRVTGSTTLVGAVSSSAGATLAGSLSSSGDIAVTGAAHAANFYGDGSGLTNISADGVDVTSSTGDISYAVVFTEGFQSNGSLGLGGNTGLIYNPSDGVLSSSAAAQIVGNSIFGGTVSVSGATTLVGTASVSSVVATGSLSGSSTLQAVGATTLGNTLNVSGAVTLAATASVSSVTATGSISGSSTLQAVGATTLGSTLAVSGAATLAATGSFSSVNMTGSLSGSHTAVFGSSISSSGDVAVTGNVHAAAYYGDGSNLTGVDAVSGSSRHYSATGLETSGYLKVTGSTTLAGTGSVSSIVATGSISGSSTLQAVGATILGNTLNVSGATTLAATASVSSVVATGSISGSSTLQAVGATILGSTLDVSGAVTVEGSVSSSGQVYAGDITLAPNAGNATPQILFTSPGGGAEITSTGAGTFNLVSNAVLELRAGSSSDLQLGANGRTGDVVLGSSGQLSSSYGAAFVQSVSSSGDVAVTGNVHAAAYYGDGSNLTGVDAVSGSSRHYSSTGLETSGYLKVTGSTTLAGTGSVSSLVATGSISGSSTLEAGGATILGSTLAVSGAATLAATGSFSSVNMTGSLSGSHTAVFGSSISSSGDVAVTGNVHAAAYYGDGANLTNVGVSGSARHYSATGFETSGYLRVTGSTTLVGTGSVSSLVATGSISGSSTLQAVGATVLGSSLGVSGSTTFAGGITHNRTAITAATYTILVTDYYVGADTSSNAITLTLPAAATAGAGKTYVVKDEGGNAATNSITIDGDGSETIDGAVTVDITSPYGAVNLYTDGAAWFVY